MILEALSWIRFLIALAAMYFFLYEYMFKKYVSQLQQFDQFNWRSDESKLKEIQSLFNFQSNPIEGQHFSNPQNNRSLSGVGSLLEIRAKDSSFKSSSPDLNLIQDKLKTQSSLQDSLFVEKVNSYQFDFYNWYRFQLTFTDLGHDSYLEFRLIEIKKGSNQILQRVPFQIPSDFYPLHPNDTQNSLDIHYQSHGISLNITQTTFPAHYNDPESDGLQNQKLLYLTQNKNQITQEQYKKFGSAKTLTNFNFTFERKDYEIRLHATHVIRHNQCVTSEENGKVRHKCMGGYGKGKLGFNQFIRQKIDTKENKYVGNWQRNAYNLDNSRVRTIFVGERILKNKLGELELSPQGISNLSLEQVSRVVNDKDVTYNSVQVDFLGFHKLEYYAKRDKIQKERWVGMSLYQRLDQNGSPVAKSVHENSFFINGNIHRIDNVELSLPMTLSNMYPGQIIRFKNQEVQGVTPTFDIEFEVANTDLVNERRLKGQKRVYRIDGYCRGWIDEGSLFKEEKQRTHYNQTSEYGHVSFYEIMGTIKFTEQLN